MLSWQAQTARELLCHAPSWLGSIQITLAWLAAWAGQCITTELGGWITAISNLRQMTAGFHVIQRNTQLALKTNSVLSWEVLGKEG